MSRPLNPNAQSFQPKSSSSSSLIPFIHLPNATVPPPSSLLSPSDFLHVLPQYPLPHHHLQLPPFYHQFPPKEQICYGFPPPPPPLPPKVISDYTHHGSMMIMATLNLYKDSTNIGTGCFLKSTSTGRSRRCSSKKLQLPPPPPPSHHRHQIRSSTSSCCSTTKKKQWQRKSMVLVNGGGGGAASASSANVVDVPKPPPYSSGQVQRFGKKTSVMIKNIPSRYCREMLLKLLVGHCKEENEKEIKSVEDLKESAFDFLYLPIDFETECNKGYAFVNFTNPNGVWRLYKYLNNYEWDVFNSKKICEVTYARIQGKDSLIRHFNRSIFACEKDEYLPVNFKPFLDGSVQDEAVEVVTVGTRSMPSPSSQQLSILRRGHDHIHQQVKRNHDEDEKDGEEDHP